MTRLLWGTVAAALGDRRLILLALSMAKANKNPFPAKPGRGFVQGPQSSPKTYFGLNHFTISGNNISAVNTSMNSAQPI